MIEETIIEEMILAELDVDSMTDQPVEKAEDKLIHPSTTDPASQVREQARSAVPPDQ